MSNNMLIKVADIDYNKDDSDKLRDALIKLRNEKLDVTSFDPLGAVVLSHTIAWMYEAIKVIYNDKS